MATLDQAELVTIGRIERSFGVRGEARVRLRSVTCPDGSRHFDR